MGIFAHSRYCSPSVSKLCDVSICPVKPSLLQRQRNSNRKSIKGNLKDFFDVKRKKIINSKKISNVSSGSDVVSVRPSS